MTNDVARGVDRAAVTPARPTLGPTLRAYRERMPPPHPHDVTTLRHTPGWRREELAARAGVSAEYITQIEQGRATTPSVQVLRALATALALSYQEQVHFFELADRQPPPPPNGLPPSMLEMVPRLENPAALCNAAWDLITWNKAWAGLIGDVTGLPLKERNLVLRHFYRMPGRFRRDEQQSAFFESGIVADLRASVGRNPHDRRLNAVIDDLLGYSERFRALWAAPAAGPYDREVKSLFHPQFGSFQLDCVVMDTRHLDYRVILLSAAPGSDGENVLRQFRASI